MKSFNLIAALIFTISAFAEEGRLGREANEYRYTSLGIDVIQTEKTGIGARLSVALPGPLYLVVERKAEGVDTKDDSYDRIVNAARIGAQIGIGDLLSNVSAKGVNLGIKNFFDVYGEFGVKATSIEGDINSFSEDDAQANVIAGIRFGDSNQWEGKIFADYSKESDVVQKTCPVETVCPAVVEFVLSEETDQKYGASFLYNITKRTAFSVELSSSKVFDSTFKIGYQINF
jgi:hypothetical protein|tara:strand:+ start:5627 stop:6319 length:693 start_codon:yes stop_codon:yes gene_type:complete